MPAAPESRPAGENQEAEVFSAITAFEQILEVMPNDRTSIETLAHAYEQIGDLTRARDYALRLAQVVMAEEDHEAAQGLVARVQTLAGEDAAALEIVRRLQAFAARAPAERAVLPIAAERSPEPPTAVRPAPAAPPPGVRTTFNISSELPLAWNLLKANELTQDEYASVIHDLTEMSATEAAVTISVLHVLHDRQFKNLPKILASVAKDCSTPVIALSGFELQPPAFTLLPWDLMVKRGVVLFDFFGNDALAVIMNPYDRQLMKDVETLAGRRCHFYLTPPPEFDSALAKVRAWMEQQAKETPTA